MLGSANNKVVENDARIAGLSTIVERLFLNMIYFLGPWKDDRNTVDISSEGWTVFWGWVQKR